MSDTAINKERLHRAAAVADIGNRVHAVGKFFDELTRLEIMAEVVAEMGGFGDDARLNTLKRVIIGVADSLSAFVRGDAVMEEEARAVVKASFEEYKVTVERIRVDNDAD